MALTQMNDVGLLTARTAYKYVPLTLNDREIRLVHLLPGTSTEPLVIDFKTVKLSGLGDPYYEALSYTWGTEISEAALRIAGSTECIRTTRNLAEALQQLRYENRQRILWVDALSINQTDLGEKGHQVAFMSEVYKFASKVLIWLGPTGDITNIAFKWITLVHEHLLVAYGLKLVPQTDDHTWADLAEPLPLPETETAALALLLQRPWFTRLWVWQELILGEERSTIMCGDDMIEASLLINAVRAVLAKAYTINPCTQALNNSITQCAPMLVARYGPIYKGFPEEILSCCDNLRSCDCTDPRDRIYAAFGPCGVTLADTGLVPDYSKSVQEVYEDFALWHTRQSQNLSILSYVGNTNKLQGLPSWVPDWTANPLRAFAPGGNAAGASERWFQRPGPGRIRVAGKIVAHVKERHLLETNTDQRTHRATSTKHFTECIKALIRLGTIVPKAENLEMYLNVLWASRFRETMAKPVWALRSACADLLKDIFALDPEDDSYPTSEAFVHPAYEAMATINDRCIFTTTEGGCGLAPRDTRVRDIVIVVLGCQMAMTMRPLEEAETYHLVGRTYLHGFMNREALLDPLPPDYETTELQAPDGSIYVGYRHFPSNSISSVDPRMGEPPLGWKRMPHESEEYFEMFNQPEKGEFGNSFRWDPRLDVRVLEAAGHQFQTFTLV